VNLRKRASLGLVVILIAATLGIFAYVMANGSTPVGPPIPSPTGSSLDISVLGTPVVTSATEIDYTDGNICVVDAGGGVAETELCEDITIVDRLSITTANGEYIDVGGGSGADLLFSGRDSFQFMLDNNNNTANSDLCIRANAVATDIWCVDESGELTLATLDGDLNTFVDIKPDSFDSIDAGADEECATYEGTNTIEWQACGSGTSLDVNLPVESGGSPTTTNYSSIPGVTFVTSGGAFVVAGDIYLQPFQTSQDITINRVSFEVTSAGNPGDACRIGLYEDSGNLQAGALVADWGQVVNDTTGYKHTTVSTAISAGSYLMAFICDTGPALRGYNGKSYLSGGVDTSTTSATRFINTMRVSSPSGTQFASGFADPGDDWDTVDLNTAFNYGYYMLLRWS